MFLSGSGRRHREIFSAFCQEQMQTESRVPFLVECALLLFRFGRMRGDLKINFSLLLALLHAISYSTHLQFWQ